MIQRENLVLKSLRFFPNHLRHAYLHNTYPNTSNRGAGIRDYSSNARQWFCQRSESLTAALPMKRGRLEHETSWLEMKNRTDFPTKHQRKNPTARSALSPERALSPVPMVPLTDPTCPSHLQPYAMNKVRLDPRTQADVNFLPFFPA